MLVSVLSDPVPLLHPILLLTPPQLMYNSGSFEPASCDLSVEQLNLHLQTIDTSQMDRRKHRTKPFLAKIERDDEDQRAPASNRFGISTASRRILRSLIGKC